MRIYSSFYWCGQLRSTLQRPYRDTQEKARALKREIIEKHVFLDQCWQDLDVKVFRRIKGVSQFYSRHAACPHELLNKLRIDAGGERAGEEMKIESVAAISSRNS